MNEIRPHVLPGALETTVPAHDRGTAHFGFSERFFFRVFPELLRLRLKSLRKMWLFGKGCSIICSGAKVVRKMRPVR